MSQLNDAAAALDRLIEQHDAMTEAISRIIDVRAVAVLKRHADLATDLTYNALLTAQVLMDRHRANLVQMRDAIAPPKDGT